MKTQQLTVDWVLRGIAHADSWRDKGDLSQENSCLEGSLMNYLSLAGKTNADLDSASTWLCSHSVPELLHRYYQSTCALADKVDAGKLPNSVIAGNCSYVIFAHVAWALDEFALGEQFLQVARREDVLELSTPFWTEYSRALELFIDDRPYDVPELKLVGEERYWSEYLHLISSMTHNNDLQSTISKISVSFEKRNRDKTIDDWYSTDGSGHEPAQWDYRRDSLLNYCDKRFSK